MWTINRHKNLHTYRISSKITPGGYFFQPPSKGGAYFRRGVILEGGVIFFSPPKKLFTCQKLTEKLPKILTKNCKK